MDSAPTAVIDTAAHVAAGPSGRTETRQRERRSLGPLRMVFAAAMAYPSRVATAGVALLVTASATLAIPSTLR